jgi:hypothetical protein
MKKYILLACCVAAVYQPLRAQTKDAPPRKKKKNIFIL